VSTVNSDSRLKHSPQQQPLSQRINIKSTRCHGIVHTYRLALKIKADILLLKTVAKRYGTVDSKGSSVGLVRQKTRVLFASLVVAFLTCDFEVNASEALFIH
jgi:hypothetical protein